MEPGLGAGEAATPTFSVVIAAFNSADRIEAVIDSVLAQTRADLELIVVDDGSTDYTAEVVGRIAGADPRVRLVRQENAGTVRARNAGLALTRGSFVSFLDDDDLWLPGYLEAVGAAFGASPAVGLAHSDASVTTGPGDGGEGYSAHDRFTRAIRRMPAEADPETALRTLLRVNFVTTCAATVSRPALESAGDLDPAIVGCDDWDLWVRVATAGFGVARIPERLVVRRLRPDSVGADERLMARGALGVLDKFLRAGGSPRAERIARRHRWLIGRELQALEDESHPRQLFWGGLRRLGRKRIQRSVRG